jgi:uncharacterized BrkB/YihY/UPF0761 family membrane protein
MTRPRRSRILTASSLWWVLKHALIGWWNDNVPRLGASLAYYTLFALAPILVVAIAARWWARSRAWSAARARRRSRA